MSLRSILGGSRINKRPSAKPRSTSHTSSSSSPNPSSLDSWPRTKPATAKAGRRKCPASRPPGNRGDGGGGDDDYFADHDDGPLPDHGLVRALADDPALRDVPQAMRHARSRMFDPLPASHAGMGSARVSATLRYRAALPPVVTAAHVHALLRAAGPTAVEREAADLVRAGAVRRIVVLRRARVGEALVLAADLERLVAESSELDAATRDAFAAFLRRNPAAVRVPPAAIAGDDVEARGGDGRPAEGLLLRAQTDRLVRAGFLTAQHTGHDAGSPTGTFTRPEDRYSLMSLEAVSQAASGSMGAVGGVGALHAAGGSGAGRAGGPTRGVVGGSGDLLLAVPGHGAYLKLVSSALDHLASLLEKAHYREATESALREKWEGGVAHDEAALAKRSRGEFVGILPGRTKKWKEFHGLSFDWVLQEAVGVGLVEMFETRSVGRAVRLV